jgi:methylmalonyl-CoA mutase, N-terminal domain
MTTDEAASSAAGIPLRPFYAPPDGGGDYAGIGDPGTYPYTRGRMRPLAARRRGWIHRELSGEGSPRRSNEQLQALLAGGALGIDVIGDNPTMSALDPDHPMCVPAVGTTGVSLCRKQDFVELLEGIPLGEITLSHSLPPAFALAGQYLASPRHGIDPRVLRGSAIQPPLYSEDCSYATFLPFATRMRLTLDSIVFALREMPRFHAFLEDTYYISDGGLDAVEEMSLGFLEIREVCRRLLARGVPVDSFAPRIAILVNCRMDLFEEIAKIRATRRLFARMMREEFGATDPRSWSVNIAVHTSGLTLTAAQPANNIVRGAVQALAMAMAGVQGLEISTFDEPFRTPSAIAHQVAIRTQQVIHTETNITAVEDPLGGSWYLESLTDELERRIDAAVREMEALGDAGTLAENGYFRSIFLRGMDRHSSAVQNGDLRVVGVNEHVVAPEDDWFLRDIAEQRFEPDYAHVERIRAWRPGRSEAPLQAGLERVREASADPDADLMGPIVAALDADATIGEITGCLREGAGLPADPFEFAAARQQDGRRPDGTRA